MWTLAVTSLDTSPIMPTSNASSSNVRRSEYAQLLGLHVHRRSRATHFRWHSPRDAHAPRSANVVSWDLDVMITRLDTAPLDTTASF